MEARLDGDLGAGLVEERGTWAWDIDCGLVKGAEAIGDVGVAPR